VKENDLREKNFSLLNSLKQCENNQINQDKQQLKIKRMIPVDTIFPGSNCFIDELYSCKKPSFESIKTGNTDPSYYGFYEEFHKKISEENQRYFQNKRIKLSKELKNRGKVASTGSLRRINISLNKLSSDIQNQNSLNNNSNCNKINDNYSYNNSNSIRNEPCESLLNKVSTQPIKLENRGNIKEMTSITFKEEKKNNIVKDFQEEKNSSFIIELKSDLECPKIKSENFIKQLPKINFLENLKLNHKNIPLPPLSGGKDEVNLKRFTFGYEDVKKPITKPISNKTLITKNSEVTNKINNDTSCKVIQEAQKRKKKTLFFSCFC
jgi:hypothetical protein